MYNAILKCSKGHVNQILISSFQDLDEMCKICKCSTCDEVFNDEEWKYVKTVPVIP